MTTAAVTPAPAMYRVVSPEGDAARGNAALAALAAEGYDGWIAWLDEGDRIEGEAALLRILAAVAPDAVAAAVLVFTPVPFAEYETAASIRFWLPSTGAQFVERGGRLHVEAPAVAELPVCLIEGTHVYVQQGIVLPTPEDADAARNRADPHRWSLDAVAAWEQGGPVEALTLLAEGLQCHGTAVDLWWTAFKATGFGLWSAAEATIRGVAPPSVALPALPDLLDRVATAKLGEVAPAADLHGTAARLRRLLRRPTTAPAPSATLDRTRPAFYAGVESTENADPIEVLTAVFGFVPVTVEQVERILLDQPVLVFGWPLVAAAWASPRLMSLWVGGWPRIEAVGLGNALAEALAAQACRSTRVLWMAADPPPGGADVLPFVDRPLRDLSTIGVDIPRRSGEVAVLGRGDILPRVVAAAAAGAAVIHVEEGPDVAARIAGDYDARLFRHGVLPREERIRLLRRACLHVAPPAIDIGGIRSGSSSVDGFVYVDAVAAGCPTVGAGIGEIAALLGSGTLRDARIEMQRSVWASTEDRNVAVVAAALRRLGFPLPTGPRTEKPCAS